MFNKSLFGNEFKETIKSETDVIIVSDLFVEDYPFGGAELTLEALVESSPLEVQKVHSKDVTLDLLEKGFQKYWIFVNFSQLNYDLIPTIVSNLNYSIMECDYKYCKYRSPEKHYSAENVLCNCQDDMIGKITSAFMYGAKSLWWMSEKQMNHYHKMFPFLTEKMNTVLSSVFNDETFYLIKVLREKYDNNKNDKWIVLGSPSWIKGKDRAIKWCEENNKSYEVVWGISYHEMLEKLASSKGLVYLPEGGDTCPRMVIEAKLLGCELHLNENVQHSKEIWFDTDDLFDTEAYLYAARSRFWEGIKYNMEYQPSISGYTTTYNALEQEYPIKQCIESLLGFCDQVVVVDGGSSDGTWEMLVDWSKSDDKLLIHQQKRDWNHKRFAVFDGQQKALARSLCEKDFCWQQDADEVVLEKDFKKIKNIVKDFPKQGVDLLALPVIEFWGSEKKVRVDVNPWKWRLSKNRPYITHGIPRDLRLYDDKGDLYSRPGSDGCDYIRVDSYEQIPFMSFYPQEIHDTRVKAQEYGSEEYYLERYESWIRLVSSNLPTVYHYSWIDIERKIKTYKGYWSKHWQSLYDIKQEDTIENNMFFNKPWSEVTDQEIEDLAKRLSEEMGGWIFHSKVDFNRPTKWIDWNLDE